MLTGNIVRLLRDDGGGGDGHVCADDECRRKSSCGTKSKAVARPTARAQWLEYRKCVTAGRTCVGTCAVPTVARRV